MSKPDKLPTIDPNVRGIYDLLIATAEQVRKDRKSDEYRQAEKRRELVAIARREAQERERQEVETELLRQQQEAMAKDPTFIPFAPGRAFVNLREP